MKAIKLIPNDLTTAQVISSFLLDPDIFDYIDNYLRSFIGIYQLITHINQGVIHAFAVVLDDNTISGISWGNIVDNNFYAHVAFRRHVQVQESCKLMENIIIEKLNPEKLIGWIPETYRWAKLNALRIGMKPKEIVPDVFFYDKENTPIECREYVKELL